MLAVTMNDIPGWEIERTCGEVFGLTVRSRNALSQIGAGLKSLMGGELRGMTKALVDSRNEVMNRMFEEARRRGGNAIVAMRFDTSEMGDMWTEICAYGTAVVAVPVTDAAKQTAAALGYGAPGGTSQGGFPGAGQPQPVSAGQQGGSGQPSGYGPSAEYGRSSDFSQPGGYGQPGGIGQAGGLGQPAEYDRP